MHLRHSDAAFGPFLLLTAFSAIIGLSFFLIGLPEALRGRADFAGFYSSGTIIARGEAHRFYDRQYQIEVQKSLFPIPERALLPGNHPPLENALFSLLARMPYRTGYFLWLACNLAMLGFAAVGIRNAFPSLSYLFVIAILLSLPPMWIALVHGQDSIALLLIFTVGLTLLRRQKELPAGLVLGLASIKFQFLAPLALLILLARRWRVVCGIAATLSAHFLLGLAITGWEGLKQYSFMLISFTQDVTSAAVQSQDQIFPHNMPNLRGILCSVIPRNVGSFIVVLLVILCSAALLFWTAARTKGASTAHWFAIAIAVTVFTSYHCYSHDGLLLALPIAAASQNSVSTSFNIGRWWAIVLLTFAPLWFLLLSEKALWLMGIAVIGLSLVLVRSETARARAATA